MDIKLLELLCCPSCKGELQCRSDVITQKGLVQEGGLTCKACHQQYPIVRFIPRFVPMENYTGSFGYQWNLFKYTQVDQYSKVQQSEQRFYAETAWSKDTLQDQWILEAGCGNGRFIDVCSRANCQVVGIDMSSAIDAARTLFKDRPNVHLVQASIYALPFKPGVFDKCYSIGVIQHTPDPKKSIQALPAFVKKGGQIVLTIYERRPWTRLYGKYLLRPLTKRMNKNLLLWMIKCCSVILFPLTEILFRVPLFKKAFQFIIPFANYVEKKELTWRQRYEWAILDTFDMLSPAYDQPMTEREVYRSLTAINITNIKRLANPGVNVVAVK